MRDHVQIRYQRGLKNDWNIASVEQFDRIAAVLASISGRFDWQINAEALLIESRLQFPFELLLMLYGLSD